MAKNRDTGRTARVQEPGEVSAAMGITADDYQLLIDSVRDCAILLLDPEGYILTWNPGGEAIKGYRPEEIIGKHFSCFYNSEDMQRGKPEMELKAAAAEGRFEDEGWRVRKDGSRFWANVVITALRNQDGTLRGFGKMTRDLTERRQAEETVARQAREIMEISTPVVQIWDGVVVAPLIGTLDSMRTQQLMERLLNRIVETNSRIALLDVTGVPAIDTRTAQHVIETLSSVRLLGAYPILTGVRPAIAQTLAHLGIDMADTLTRSSLAAGLRAAMDILGLKVAPKNGNP